MPLVAVYLGPRNDIAHNGCAGHIAAGWHANRSHEVRGRYGQHGRASTSGYTSIGIWSEEKPRRVEAIAIGKPLQRDVQVGEFFGPLSAQDAHPLARLHLRGRGDIGR